MDYFTILNRTSSSQKNKCKTTVQQKSSNTEPSNVCYQGKRKVIQNFIYLFMTCAGCSKGKATNFDALTSANLMNIWAIIAQNSYDVKNISTSAFYSIVTEALCCPIIKDRITSSLFFVFCLVSWNSNTHSDWGKLKCWKSLRMLKGLITWIFELKLINVIAIRKLYNVYYIAILTKV